MDPNPDPRKEIEVDPDPDLDPERGLKWIRIRIWPNAVDPGGSGSGSETLINNRPFLKLLQSDRPTDGHAWGIYTSNSIYVCIHL